jgi:hypothetical protein
MQFWTVRDYLAENGENVIRTWLDGLSAVAQADIDAQIQTIERTETLTRPAWGKLGYKNGQDCRELYEIRVKCEGVQYRPLTCFGPGRRMITILIGATERDSRLVPGSVCRTALARKLIIETTAGRTCLHEPYRADTA